MAVESAHLLAHGAVARLPVMRAQLLPAAKEFHVPLQSLGYLSCRCSSSEWRVISGICVRMKRKVRALKPNSLNAAQ